MIVKILGSGCSSCNQLEKNAKEAIATLGVQAEFVKVKDFKEIAAYGVLRTPALVVNEEVLSFGKVLPASEIEKLLKDKI